MGKEKRGGGEEEKRKKRGGKRRVITAHELKKHSFRGVTFRMCKCGGGKEEAFI